MLLETKTFAKSLVNVQSEVLTMIRFLWFSCHNSPMVKCWRKLTDVFLCGFLYFRKLAFTLWTHFTGEFSLLLPDHGRMVFGELFVWHPGCARYSDIACKYIQLYAAVISDLLSNYYYFFTVVLGVWQIFVVVYLFVSGITRCNVHEWWQYFRIHFRTLLSVHGVSKGVYNISWN